MMMANKTKAALQGRQCRNAYQMPSQLITLIDQVNSLLAGGAKSTAPLPQVAAVTLCDTRCNLVERRGNGKQVKTIQPLGSIPCLNSSLRANAFNQLPRLTPSRLAASFNCWRNSGVIRIWKVGDRPSPFGVLSLLIVDMYVRNPLVWILLCTYVTTAYVKKATPQSVTSTTRASDQTVNEVTIMACFKSTQTHPKFQYRFLALNRHDKKSKPCRLSVEATTEHEARRILAPHFILSFAARLPVQEVHHA